MIYNFVKFLRKFYLLVPELLHIYQYIFKEHGLRLETLCFFRCGRKNVLNMSIPLHMLC